MPARMMATNNAQNTQWLRHCSRKGRTSTVEGVTEETVLEFPSASEPDPRGHRHGHHREHQHSKGLGQKVGPVGAGEEQQAQHREQHVDLAENDDATLPFFVLSVPPCQR